MKKPLKFLNEWQKCLAQQSKKKECPAKTLVIKIRVDGKRKKQLFQMYFNFSKKSLFAVAIMLFLIKNDSLEKLQIKNR